MVQLSLHGREAVTLSGMPRVFTAWFSLGWHAESAELAECDKYSDLTEGYIFCSVAFETLGGLGSAANKLIRALVRKLKDSTSDIRAAAFLRQRLVIVV